jgi:cell division septation protein DedD
MRRRRALPRAMRVALSLSRGTIAFLLFAVFGLIAGAFAAGLVVGLRVREEPMIVEKIVEKEVPKPMAAANQAPVLPSSAPSGVRAEVLPEPKLNVTIGPPDDANAWGVQIGAYPDLSAAEASLDARVAALAMYPIFIVPAEIKGKGVWHRVRVGTFKTRADAEKARVELPEDVAKQAMVISYK